MFPTLFRTAVCPLRSSWGNRAGRRDYSDSWTRMATDLSLSRSVFVTMSRCICCESWSLFVVEVGKYFWPKLVSISGQRINLTFCLPQLFLVSFKVTKVTTKCYHGYYWTPKIAKNGPKQHKKLFFARRAKKASAEALRRS